MKRLNLMFLVIGVIIFFSCSKENSSLTPDLNQSDQEISILNAEEIQFTGTSISTGVILDPGTTTELPNGNTLTIGQISVWCESADVDLVSGRSIWYVNSIEYPDLSKKFWGKVDIFVGGDCSDLEGPYDGKWKLSFKGEGAMSPDWVFFQAKLDAKGNGKEGNVNGMEGKWTYTMNWMFGGPASYETEGYIK